MGALAPGNSPLPREVTNFPAFSPETGHDISEGKDTGFADRSTGCRDLGPLMGGDAQDAPPEREANAGVAAPRIDPLMASAAGAMERAGKILAAVRARLRELMRSTFARENPHSDDLPPAVLPPTGGRKAPPPARKGRGAPSPRLLIDAVGAGFSLGAVGLLGFLYAAFVFLAPRPADDADLWAVNRLPSIVILDHNGVELAARGARYGQQVSVAELRPIW